MLEVLAEGRLVELRAPKHRALLAMLALRPGEVVSADVLVEGLWGATPPSSASNTLQGYVSHLRRALGSDAIITRSPGYLLALERDAIDAGRFETLVNDGRTALREGRHAEAANLLVEALGLWRGRPLADFEYELFAAPAIVRLEELRLGATEDLVDAELALGHHTELVGRLQTLIEEHPLRERLWGQLMLALYRCGRQAEALRAFSDLRHRLGEELGIEPSRPLQTLEQAILLQDRALGWEPPAPQPASVRPERVRSTIVGRERELAVFAQTLSALVEGVHPSTLAITGPLGMGKTRLLRELARSARAGSHLVLSGRASEFEGNLPFGLLAHALQDHMKGEGPWIDTGSGVDAAVSDGDRHGLPAERYLTHYAVRAELERLADERPVVLLLDDIHWADPASVELICYLIRRPPRGKVLLVVAYRPASAPPTVLAELMAAVRQGQAEVLELRNLSAEESEALVGRRVPRAFLPYVFEESGGNPFFMEQLARVGPAGWIRDADAGSALPGLPTEIGAALGSELAGLPAMARVFLEGAAVAGDPFEPALAATAAGLSEGDALDALDLLARRELIHPTRSPRQFRFRHPIIRRLVYEGSGPGWRLASHARVAASLAASGTTGPALAHHVALSARPGDEDAIATLLKAADAVVSQAPANAARWYEAALRLVPDRADTAPRRLQLRATTAMALASAGELEAAHVHLTEGLAAAEPGDDLWLRMLCRCAGVEALLGRHGDARTRLLEALRILPPDRVAAAAAIKLELSATGAFASDLAEMKHWAMEVLVDEASAPPTVVATARSLLALVHHTWGESEEARRRLSEAVEAFDQLDDDSLADRIDNAHWLALAEIDMERFADAVAHCERAIAVSRKHGRDDWMVGLMHLQAWALTSSGRLREAVPLAAVTVDAARLAGNPLALTVALWEYCITCCLAGDLATALDAGEEAVEKAVGLDPGGITSVPALALARVRLEMGQPEQVRSDVLAGAGGPDLPFIPGVLTKLAAYELLTTAELQLGDSQAADAWATRAEAMVERGGMSLAAAIVQRARAAVLLAIGDAPRAAELALDAAEAAVAAPIEAARARLLAGRALAQSGRDDAAWAELTRARDELAACGAKRYMQEAEAELQRVAGHQARGA